MTEIKFGLVAWKASTLSASPFFVFLVVNYLNIIIIININYLNIWPVSKVVDHFVISNIDWYFGVFTFESTFNIPSLILIILVYVNCDLL